MYQLVIIVHVLAAIAVVALVLVQQGKGAVVGSSFGAGASQTIFGSRGAGSFMLKITLLFAGIFFATSIGLNWLASQAVRRGGVSTQSSLPLAVQEIMQKNAAEKAEKTEKTEKAEKAGDAVAPASTTALPSLPSLGDVQAIPTAPRK